MTENFTPPQDPHALAAELVTAGAQPAQVDAAAMLAQIQELTARMNAMAEKAGVPADPVEFARGNLLAHVKAHAAANPTAELSELSAAVEDKAVNPDLVGLLTEEAVARHPKIDLRYVAELARDFRKAVARA